MYYVWIIIASLFSTLFIAMIKLYDQGHNNLFLLFAILSQFGSLYSYIRLLDYDDILTLFIVVKILAILLVTLIGILFFSYKLTNRKIIGIVFGIIALYLI